MSYRAQLALPARALAPSTARSWRTRDTAGGLAEIARLPLTEKDELRATRTRGEPVRRASLRRAARDRPDLLDERHDRRAELHPAHRRRPRELGHRLGAQLRGLGRRRRPAHRLDLQRRPVRRRRRARRVRPDRSLPRPGRHRQHRAPARGDRAAAAGGGGADAVVRRVPRGEPRPARLERRARPRRRASPAAASRRSARSSRRAGARGSPRRWGSATSASRSGASASSRTGCTSARAASSTRS